jgi:hypothetical protein
MSSSSSSSSSSSLWRSGRVAWVAIPVVVLGLLSGCTPEPLPSGGVTPTRAPSPLEPYVGALYGGGSEEGMAAQNAAIQDAVAACMKEEGFEYTPDAGLGGASFSTDEMEIPWGTEEFAKTYGYGVSTDAFADMGGGGEYEDPNQEYIDSLSPGEQAAYSTALWGQPLEGPSKDSTDSSDSSGSDDVSVDYTDTYDWEQAGCMGAAQHEHGSEAASDDPEFESLMKEMQNIFTAVDTDPAVAAAEEEWSGCLASAGFPGYEHKVDPMNDFSERYAKLRPALAPGEEGVAPEPDAAELEEFEAEEIATAVADFECSESTGYTATYDSTQRELEQAFVDEHKEQLDALVARYGTK